MGFDDSVLICDEVDQILNKILGENGLQVTYEPLITPEQILEKIDQFNIVIVRSRTKITKEMIDKANNCKIIARVGVGLDNIDLDAAKEKKHSSNQRSRRSNDCCCRTCLGIDVWLSKTNSSW